MKRQWIKLREQPPKFPGLRMTFVVLGCMRCFNTCTVNKRMWVRYRQRKKHIQCRYCSKDVPPVLTTHDANFLLQQSQLFWCTTDEEINTSDLKLDPFYLGQVYE